MFKTWKEAAEADGWYRAATSPISLYHEESGVKVPDGEWETAARFSGVEQSQVEEKGEEE